MNWYLAKLIFSIDTENPNKKAQFDEQLRLIKAVDTNDAYFKAKNLGSKLQTKIFNQNDEAILWNFVDVCELIEVNEIKDGVEVYSNTHETYERENFIHSVKQKGMAIQSKNLLFF
jgi:hypothetical protein